jgi:hypothetical protein
MSEDKILHEFQKNAGEKVITSFSVFKGKKLVSVRVYYQAGEDWKPTPKGLTLRREMILDLKEAVDAAAQAFEKEQPGSEEPENIEDEKIPF